MNPGESRAQVPGGEPGRCPICGKPADPGSPERPFCSRRCKLVDLGRWLKGHYAIPGEPTLRLPVEGGDDEPEPDR